MLDLTCKCLDKLNSETVKVQLLLQLFTSYITHYTICVTETFNPTEKCKRAAPGQSSNLQLPATVPSIVPEHKAWSICLNAKSQVFQLVVCQLYVCMFVSGLIVGLPQLMLNNQPCLMAELARFFVPFSFTKFKFQFPMREKSYKNHYIVNN